MSTYQRPLILISSGRDVNERGYERFCVLKLYPDAVAASQMIPVLALHKGLTEEYVKQCDGLLLTGGVDVSPALYQAERNPATQASDDLRDQIESELLDSFSRHGKPILGICRGIQMINAFFGGTLVQDLPVETYGEHRDGKLHNIISTQGSQIEKLFGSSFVSNSYHHQGLKTLAPGFVATSYSDNGFTPVIESIEHESLPIMAVQWHPERMMEYNQGYQQMSPLFDWFSSICQSR